MRATTEQIGIFRKLALSHFGEDAGIWLFGSRVDDVKRGGDYDFLIETALNDPDEIAFHKIALLSELQNTFPFEDEKIDIVVKRRLSTFEMPIYKVAINEGVRI